MTRCIVIGAGVIGASVAFRLAQAGASVTVLEAGRVGGGTSGASFAWTNANNKPPRAYHDLNVAGMRAHAALREEFGETPWWHGGGSVEWALEEGERSALRERVTRLRSWDYAAEWLTPPQLKELEPDIDLAAVGDAPIAYYPEDGWLDPVPYAHAMVDAALRAGATLRCGVRVTQVRVEGGRVTGVGTAGGETFRADIVVNCAGRWADEVGQLAGLRIPLAPTAGLLVFTPPIATGLRRVVRAPQCHMHPDGAGRLMLQTDDGDRAVTAETRAGPSLPPAQEVVRRASLVLPGLAGVAPEAARIGVRPFPADGYSAVGAMPGVTGFYVVVTHSGVTLAPFLGRAVAAELVGGRIDPRLEGFRPSRFLDQGSGG
jgi:glycine/D-amino acid oxidase-like deaminating enzyme